MSLPKYVMNKERLREIASRINQLTEALPQTADIESWYQRAISLHKLAHRLHEVAPEQYQEHLYPMILELAKITVELHLALKLSKAADEAAQKDPEAEY